MKHSGADPIPDALERINSHSTGTNFIFIQS